MRTRSILLLVLGLAQAACEDNAGPPTDPPTTDPSAVGTLVVSTVSGGKDPDQDGYLLTVDGIDSLRLDPTGTSQIDLTAGHHTLRLLGMAEHCSVSPGTPLEVDVPSEGTTAVAFEVTCSISGAPAPPPPASGLLAFVYDCDIYVMDWSGAGTQQLTSNGPHRAEDRCDSNPEWSPDGTRIAFSRYDGGYIHEIHVINADGTGLLRISPQGVEDHHPTWSPDGSRIAFEHRPDNRSGGDIWTMNADGTDRVRVTTDPEPEEYPVWSPKGDRIAFMSYGRADGASDIFGVNLDGTDRVNLTGDHAFDVDVAWSPDGERLVAARNGELLLLNPDGSQRSQLTQGVFAAQAPTWSPDGTTIAFNRLYPCTGTFELPTCPPEVGLWTVRLSDGHLERVPLLGGGDADWHP
jgi:TolB protein